MCNKSVIKYQVKNISECPFGQMHSALYLGYGYVPLRFGGGGCGVWGGDVVRKNGKTTAASLIAHAVSVQVQS